MNTPRFLLAIAWLLALLSEPRRPLLPFAPDTFPVPSDSLARVCKKEQPDTALRSLTLLAHADNAFSPSLFCFTEHGTRYLISSAGSARRGSAEWSIPLDSGFAIEGLYYGRRGARLLLMYQVSDGEDGMGYLYAVNTTSLAGQWPAPVPISLNLSPPLLDDSVAYLSGLDVVAKVDLTSGHLSWRHVFYIDDLRNTGRTHYYSFGRPWREGPTVSFPERALATSVRVDTLRLVDSTGQIVAPAIWSNHRVEP